jgi:hypothetical protein
MWRPARGATSKPGPCRPASGYGRVLGRPGPPAGDSLVEPVTALDPAVFDELGETTLDVPVEVPIDADVEAPAPVTP